VNEYEIEVSVSSLLPRYQTKKEYDKISTQAKSQSTLKTRLALLTSCFLNKAGRCIQSWGLCNDRILPNTWYIRHRRAPFPPHFNPDRRNSPESPRLDSCRQSQKLKFSTPCFRGLFGHITLRSLNFLLACS